MKYPKLNSVVPAGEHFDESAINEGVYLTTGHVNNIESALVAGAQASADLQTANTTIDGLNTTVSGLQKTDGEKDTTINTQKQKITELEAAVQKLGGEPSGPGTVVKPAAKEEVVKETVDEGLPKFDSADHPANAFADAHKQYDSGVPGKK